MDQLFDAIGDDITQGGVLFPLLVLQGVSLAKVFYGDDCGHITSKIPICFLSGLLKAQVHFERYPRQLLIQEYPTETIPDFVQTY